MQIDSLMCPFSMSNLCANLPNIFLAVSFLFLFSCEKNNLDDDNDSSNNNSKKHTASFARSTGKFPSRDNNYR